MNILAIESSCDETSSAVLSNGKILSNVIATQVEHQQHGGVIPELASRAHQRLIIPTVQKALDNAKIDKSALDAIAFTRGPGLLGSLLVGTSFAKSLALGLGVPLIDVHHMQAHVLAHFIEDPVPGFPFLCLTVSGGHTQIVLVRDYLDMTVIGRTLDDAAGEAFDKGAKLLGLTYPGGPLIDKLAAGGDPGKFQFPIAEISGLDFSFSGVKTALLYFLQERTTRNPEFIEENLADICASYQYTLVETLARKIRKAARQTDIREIAIAGGVSANSGLRSRLEAMAEKEGWDFFAPRFEYCTDNAAMIAKAAEFKFKVRQFSAQDVAPLARMPF